MGCPASSVPSTRCSLRTLWTMLSGIPRSLSCRRDVLHPTAYASDPMLLIGGTLLAGIGAGFAMGGSLRRLGDVHFRWWGLAFLGLALQLAPVPSGRGNGDHILAVGLLVASYVV